ncbi:uncharacterized protein DS421_1g29150 [Arachis hypogaea]|nr:uncharacterized protein DS421_1g29150 [Arachis hypogaea]
MAPVKLGPLSLLGTKARKGGRRCKPGRELAVALRHCYRPRRLAAAPPLFGESKGGGDGGKGAGGGGWYFYP